MIYNELKIEELRDQVTDLRREVADLTRENAELRGRLDGGGSTHYGAACKYADSLVVEGMARFGTLAKLEWMLRTVVGASRRQAAIGDDLRAKLRALQTNSGGSG
jgi:hypothetical protein